MLFRANKDLIELQTLIYYLNRFRIKLQTSQNYFPLKNGGELNKSTEKSFSKLTIFLLDTGATNEEKILNIYKLRINWVHALW